MSSDSTSASDSATDSAPEPLDLAISPAVRRKLQQCFDHASKLATQEKFDRDYVATLLASCVQGDPGNLVYVDAFLDNLQKKYDNNKKGAKLRGFGNKGAAVKKAASKADWKEVFKLGPEALKTNPWDVVVLRSLAEACEAYAFNEVELRWLKNALDANPKDVDVNRHCAESLARMGQYEQAIVCWHRIEESKKDSAEAAEMISRLTLERNRERAGYARERGSAPVVKPSTRRLAGITRTATVKPKPSDSTTLGDENDGTESPAAPRREIPLTERQKLEQAIREFPLRADNYLKLAQLHIDEQRHAEAERHLAKTLEISSGDLKAREMLEDVQILRMKDQAALAEQRAQEEDTPANRELAARMKTELLQREMALFASRSERYPTDIGLKYELALRLKRAGNYAEAIKLFQEVRENPEQKATATLLMGECLQQLRQFPKAQQCYDRAVALAEAGTEFRKLALYRAGVLALGVRDLEKARSRLSELAALDAAYKDVQARLDKLAALGDTA